MSDFNTTTVVINRRTKPTTGGRGGRGGAARAPVSAQERRLRAIEDNEEGSMKKTTVSRKFGTAIAQARAAKKPKLTQKELAQRSQVPLNIISEWEAGRGKPNPQYRAKLERVLGVKLPAN